jgi:hypothetical protein
MHIPVWVVQGWYTKHRGYDQWRKKRHCNESSATFLSLEKVRSQCGSGGDDDNNKLCKLQKAPETIRQSAGCPVLTGTSCVSM